MSGDNHIRCQHDVGTITLDVDIPLKPRGTLAVFGESGAGKTTLLRCIAGLAQPADASICIAGETWQDNKTFVPPHRRRVGYVFQEPRLFAGTVQRNLDFAARRARDDRIESDAVVETLALKPLLSRDAMTLSGGEARRVAIARALLSSPRLLLMDEPTASLDVRQRAELTPYFARLNNTLDIPVIYVSHDVDELVQIADDMLVIEEGTVLAHDTLQSVVADASLPGLSGSEAGVIIEGRRDSTAAIHGLQEVTFDGGRLWVAAQDLPAAPRLRIRANDVSLCRTRPGDSSVLNLLDARVTAIVDESEVSALVTLSLGTQPLLSRITQKSRHALGLSPGQDIVAQIKSVAVRGGGFQDSSTRK